MKCPDTAEEVCGNDGVTYTNQCHLRKATCTSGIELAHHGKCTDLDEDFEKCPAECPDDPANTKRVICASDGNTYRYII